MKGLLKGLRYITQIFDAKEPEMQIGQPTDVKHVAHIGWDNASVTTAPSWMNEFKASPGTARGGDAEPSQPVGSEEPGEEQTGGEDSGGKAERPRRTKGNKGSAAEGSRRDRRGGKAADAAEGADGDAAAAPKQRRRKPRAATTRSKSSSGGTAALDSEAALPAGAPTEGDDDRDGS